MEYLEFIKPELLILVPFLYGLGAILKTAQFIEDKFIPVLLTAVSLALCVLYVIGTEGVSPISVFTAIVQSVICVACAVYGNQVIKQLKKK